MTMFSDIKVKREYYEEIEQKIIKEETLKKKIKVEDNLTRDPRIRRRLADSFGTNPQIKTIVPDIKHETKDIAKHSFSAPNFSSYDSVLQEIFQWSPEWLSQGRVTSTPPLLKFDRQMKIHGYKYEYDREEYVSRYLPYILSNLFLKLSDAFKNKLPVRRPFTIVVSKSQNYGLHEMNKLLECYVIRDIRDDQPIASVSDIITISLSVTSGRETKIPTKKKYFGLIASISMIEYNDMECEILANYPMHWKPGDRPYLIWNRLTILTKRAQNSHIIGKQMAEMDVLMNASVETRLIQNMMTSDWKCPKLVANILKANANIHQYSDEDLKDKISVDKTLAKNAEDLINKASPMVFLRGNNHVMVVDISDDSLRFQYLSDMTITLLHKFSDKRFLLITQNDQDSVCWRDKLKRNVRNNKIKVWSLERSPNWSGHKEVRRFVLMSAQKGLNSCDNKLKSMSESNANYYEIIKRKDIYQKLTITKKTHLYQTPPIYITRQELSSKGFECMLSESDVVIGTLDNVLDCRQLLPEKSFDCCIIADSHLMADPFVMSILHFDVKSIIIGGDSDYKPVFISPIDEYNTSLFDRVFRKVNAIS